MIKPAVELWVKGNVRKTILLNRSVTRIGRHEDNDIVLRNIGVSRHHAKIVDDDGAFTVHDLQSANGVIVNREPAERATLVSGDEILIGKFMLRFVTVDNARGDLAAGGYVFGDDAPAGPTFEVRGAMARKIRDEIQAPREPSPATAAPGVPAGAVQHVLRAMRGDEWLFEKVLEPGLYEIGRSPENDVILASANVSRHHASLAVSSEGFAIEDRGSRNGVKVNGEAAERRSLVVGDEIVIGDFRLLLVCEDLLGHHAVIEGEALEALEADDAAAEDPAAASRAPWTAGDFEIEHEPRWAEPEAAAESSGGVSFAYPVRDAEITIQVAGWSSTLTFQPDSLRRATGAEADEDRIVVRVEFADGIRRFSFSIDDMQPEDEG